MNFHARRVRLVIFDGCEAFVDLPCTIREVGDFLTGGTKHSLVFHVRFVNIMRSFPGTVTCRGSVGNL